MKPQLTLFKSELLNETYLFGRHASGLPVYIFPKPFTAVNALFAAEFGSVDFAADAAGRDKLPDGTAHFLEHKLFTNPDGSDAMERFAALGADANAYTSPGRTVYLFSATERYEAALGELIDFVTRPYFTPETVEKERGIIAEEIRMCRDDPYDRCCLNMLRGLYRAHPVRIPICGTEKSVAAITPDVLYRAYRTYYTPANMALVICGNVDPDTVWKTVNAHLPPGFTANGPVPRPAVKEPPLPDRPEITEPGQVAKPLFCIGYKDTVLERDPVAALRRDAGMAILNEMLFSEAGDLYAHLFESGLISPDLSADYTATRDFAFEQICGEADDPARVAAEIQQYVDEKRRTGLSAADFERCRRVEYAEYIKSFDATEEIAGNLLSFAFEGAELFSYADVLNGVDLPFVTALMDACFCPERRTLSVITPKN